MATSTVRGETQQKTEPAVVMRAVKAPAVVCGDCRHHIPQATGPAAWCGLRSAERFDQQVEPGQRGCEDFTTWPEGSPVPAFLAAMRF
jgi:hypothetical protein